jgi:hypothetical protein
VSRKMEEYLASQIDVSIGPEVECFVFDTISFRDTEKISTQTIIRRLNMAIRSHQLQTYKLQRQTLLYRKSSTE